MYHLRAHRIGPAAIVALLVGLAVAAGAWAAEPDASSFYNGKLVRVIVPYSPGGGFDTYARLVAKHLERYLPGSQVYVENVPGGGGLIGTNTLHRAKADGLTIGILNTTGMILSVLSERQGVQFDIGKFSYLARITSEARLLGVGVNTPYRSLDDIVKSGRTLTVSSTGVGSDDYTAMVLEFQLLGIPYRIIAGYPGQTEANLAVVSGEVEATQASWSNLSQLVRNGDLRPILFLSSERIPDYPEVPTLLDVAPPERQRVVKALVAIAEVDRTFAAPPGVPADRLSLLRDAFEKVFADPAFVADVQAAGRPINFLHGERVAQLVADAMAGADELTKMLKSLK